ncbi:MAG: AraC family transcriptional regulator [Bacteroidaceae bacterium]|nr:AraC family transcriptional regulator [Bacteroidaceae bacterium]
MKKKSILNEKTATIINLILFLGYIAVTPLTESTNTKVIQIIWGILCCFTFICTLMPLHSSFKRIVETNADVPPSHKYFFSENSPIIREDTVAYKKGNSFPISIEEIAYKPKIEPMGKMDICFVESIIKCVSNSLSKGYTVKALSLDLGIDRAKLYRIIQGIYNCTPNDFIIAIKMAYAARQLKSPGSTLRDTVYYVGMEENTTAFVRYFKRLYKHTPAEYQKMHVNTN